MVAGATNTEDATAALPNKCVSFLFIYIFSIENYLCKFTDTLKPHIMPEKYIHIIQWSYNGKDEYRTIMNGKQHHFDALTHHNGASRKANGRREINSDLLELRP